MPQEHDDEITEKEEDLPAYAELVGHSFVSDQIEETKSNKLSNAIIPEHLSHISHELRAPLNAIKGYSDLINQQIFGRIDPRYREYLKNIFVSAQH